MITSTDQQPWIAAKLMTMQFFFGFGLFALYSP
jgi:hypothetical protein